MHSVNSNKRVRANRVEVIKKVKELGFKGREKRQFFSARKALVGLAVLLFSHTAASIDFEWSSLGLADAATVPNNTQVIGTGSTIRMNVETVLVIDGVERPLTDLSAAGTITDVDVPVDVIDFNTINAGGPFSYDTGTTGTIPRYLHMEMAHGTCEANDKLIVRITWETATGDPVSVSDVQFSLMDVDQSDFDDAVQVFANGTNVRDPIPGVGTVGVTVGANSEVNNVAGLRGWDGVTNTGDTSAAANITFDFPNGVDNGIEELEIRYSSNDPCDSGLAPSNQKIGMSAVATADTTTPATVTSFSSQLRGDSVMFNWETSNEVGHLGFQLYARGQDGWHLLNTDLIVHSKPGGDAMTIKQYQYTANNLESEWFTLIDVSTAEELTPHGPYRLNETYGESLTEVAEVDWAAIRRQSKPKVKTSAALNERLNRLRKANLEEGEQ